jgi:hypothetical protein
MHMKRLATAAAALLLCAAAPPGAGAQPLWDPAEFLDESTLDVVVLDDWHVDTVNGLTRQKLVDIHVAEWWPGFEYRVRVRYIVPLGGPATGIHLTGGHSANSLLSDVGVAGFNAELIAGDIGLVHTVVQALLTGGDPTQQEMIAQFLATLNPRYTRWWIWVMNEMRAITAAYTETAHFIPGKVAATGGSKNCATPTIASINDSRFTAVLGKACSPWLSPLNVFDQDTMDEVEAVNTWFFDALASGEISPGIHSEEWYADKSFGADDDMHVLALQAGWTLEEYRVLAQSVVPYVHLSETYDALVAGGNEYLFHPGTHDWVAFDMPEGQAAYPQIPVYLRANTGHSQPAHPAAEPSEDNQEVFLRRHFFGVVTPMLETPSTSYTLAGDQLTVAVTFANGPEPASGRMWWLYDRHPGGSGAYLWELIPAGQFADMTFDPVDGVWKATIQIDPRRGSIDFWSNHGHVVDGAQTYLSSLYTRLDIPSRWRRGGRRVSNR